MFVPENEAFDPWNAIGLPPATGAEEDRERGVLVRREPTAGTNASWYTLDPLADPAPRRRFRRSGASSADPAIRVPSRPLTRPLPGSVIVSG